MDDDHYPCLDPEIVTANNARLHAHSRVHHRSVESRMCLWCKEGDGSIVVNGRRWPIRPRDYFVLPWRHAIRYEPAPEAPLYLAGIHLIPWHDSTHEPEWNVAHGPAHPLYGVPWRQDRPLPGGDTPVRHQLPHEHPLLRLSEYIVQHAAGPTRDRSRLKHCAHLLIQELADAVTQSPALPRPLSQVEVVIRQQMHRPLSVRDLARAIDRSPSQVARLCQRHLQCTPAQWIARTKMDASCEQLRTTTHSIAEIGRRVGYEDQFHFSRVFKKQVGISPLKYRQQQPML